jgi:F0F1-type ATP synthase assembly protein I
MSDSQPPKREQGGANVGWAIMSTMLGGIGLYGFAGWLIDQWLDTKFATPIGLVLGMGLAIYVIMKRFGV